MKEDIDMKLKKIFGLAGVIAASTVLLAACGGNSKSASSHLVREFSLMSFEWNKLSTILLGRYISNNELNPFPTNVLFR